MKEYSMDDLYVGLTESFTRTISDEMMNQFYAVTGDDNPLHINADYAQKHNYKDKVVYGMLTASLISTLGGCYLPGKKCLIEGVEVKFAKPVYVGDVLHIMGEVSAVYPSLGRVEIKIRIENQDGETVVRGKLKAGVLHG